MPCTDEPDVCNKGQVAEMYSAHSDNNRDCNGQETCSPMCICSCCAGFTFEKSDFSFKENTFLKVELPLYTKSWHSRFFASIWQPPQA
jgi:hypothetical protein